MPKITFTGTVEFTGDPDEALRRVLQDVGRLNREEEALGIKEAYSIVKPGEHWATSGTLQYSVDPASVIIDTKESLHG